MPKFGSYKKRKNKKMLKVYLLPFDAFERNKKVVAYLKRGETVLDIGGGVTGIKLFTDNPVKIVDLDVGDIKMDARKLKLPDESFDVVVSVDVLEHLPKKDRVAFIKRITKIAKRKVIISAPFGSKKHKLAEKRILDRIVRSGRSDFFLSQHVEYELPLPSLEAYKLGKNSKIIYSGDFRLSNFLFSFSHLETKKGIIDRPLLILKKAMNTLFNIFLYPFWFYEKPSEYTNRFYILIDK